MKALSANALKYHESSYHAKCVSYAVDFSTVYYAKSKRSCLKTVPARPGSAVAYKLCHMWLKRL